MDTPCDHISHLKGIIKWCDALLTSVVLNIQVSTPTLLTLLRIRPTAYSFLTHRMMAFWFYWWTAAGNCRRADDVYLELCGHFGLWNEDPPCWEPTAVNSSPCLVCSCSKSEHSVASLKKLCQGLFVSFYFFCCLHPRFIQFHFWLTWKKCESMYCSVLCRVAGRLIVWSFMRSQIFNVEVLSERMKAINVNLFFTMLLRWALPVHTTYSDHNHIARSLRCHSFNWTFSVLFRLGCNFAWLFLMSTRSWIYHCFCCVFFSSCFQLLLVFKGDKWRVFWFDKNVNVGFSSDTVLSEVF